MIDSLKFEVPADHTPIRVGTRDPAGAPITSRRVSMSQRIDKSWLVFESIENDEHDRCVDLFRRPDGTYGFEEFRRDVEDAGAWTPVRYYSAAIYPSKGAALSAAVATVAWLAMGGQGR